MPGDIAESELVIMSETTATVQDVNGKWSRVGMFSTYHFAGSTETMEFNWNLIPEDNRREAMFFGLQKRVLNGLGKKGLTILQKRELAAAIFKIICGPTWKSTSTDGKGGIAKTVHQEVVERADRLGKALEDERKANAAEKARMTKIIEELTAKANAKGRK